MRYNTFNFYYYFSEIKKKYLIRTNLNEKTGYTLNINNCDHFYVYKYNLYLALYSNLRIKKFRNTY